MGFGNKRANRRDVASLHAEKGFAPGLQLRPVVKRVFQPLRSVPKPRVRAFQTENIPVLVAIGGKRNNLKLITRQFQLLRLVRHFGQYNPESTFWGVMSSGAKIS